MHLRRELATAGPALALGLTLALGGSAVADASVGLGIQAGPVQLAGGAHPGGTYALPAVYVVNTGTQAESVVIRVERLSPGAGRAVPASWVQATGSAVKLSHNQSARIPLQLTVPASAHPGAYLSDVVAKGSVAQGVGAAKLGVAAATKLQFTVMPGAVSPSLFPGWLLPAFFAALFVAVAAIVVRRSGLRIRIERRNAGSG